MPWVDPGRRVSTRSEGGCFVALSLTSESAGHGSKHFVHDAFAASQLSKYGQSVVHTDASQSVDHCPVAEGSQLLCGTSPCWAIYHVPRGREREWGRERAPTTRRRWEGRETFPPTPPFLPGGTAEAALGAQMAVDARKASEHTGGGLDGRRGWPSRSVAPQTLPAARRP